MLSGMRSGFGEKKRITCKNHRYGVVRADEFLDQGNLDGQRLWMRIMQAIEEL